MDQIIFVIVGTVVVVYYILSPVNLLERVMDMLERVGRIDNTGIANKGQGVRRYYVRIPK